MSSAIYTDRVDTCEQLLITLLQKVGPKAFFVGLHNAFVHGETWPCTDQQLTDLYTHFEALVKLGKEIE